MSTNAVIIEGLKRIQTMLEALNNDLASCCRDAITVIKGKEPVLMASKIIGDLEVWCCPDCNELLNETNHFCPKCGLAVRPKDFYDMQTRRKHEKQGI